MVLVTALIAGIVGVAIGVLITTGRTDEGRTPEQAVPAAAVESGEARFVHNATLENTFANSTYLDHPLTNGNPEAVLSVTQNWNPGGEGGGTNDQPVGVWYDAGVERWAIFNQNLVPMPEGASFHVVVWRRPAEAG